MDGNSFNENPQENGGFTDTTDDFIKTLQETTASAMRIL